MGPHRRQRRWPVGDPDIFLAHPSGVSTADENGFELAANRVDATGHVDPGRTGAATTTEDQGKSSAHSQTGSA